MKKLACALTPVVFAAILISACGGGSDSSTEAAKPLDKAALAKAGDANCAYRNERLAKIGVIAGGPEGAAPMYSAYADIDEEVQRRQENLKPAKQVAADWKDYLKAGQGLIEAEREVAAKPKDTAPLDKAVAATYDPADAVGLKVCTYTPTGQAPGSGTEPPEDLSYPQPKQSVDAAATAYVTALGSGSCGRLTAVEHSDNGTVTEPTCSTIAKNFGKSKIMGSEPLGPVAAVELFDERSNRGTTVLLVEDTDGKLKHASDNEVVTGGLRPPNPG